MLEGFFGQASVVFNSRQSAISAITEVLGSRSFITPVILPVTADPHLIAAVLRSGCEPCLLDIDPSTLQMDPGHLSQTLEAVKDAVVVLTRPGGQSVDPTLLDITKKYSNVTIVDHLLPPHAEIAESVCGTFDVFDMSNLIECGAVVIHKYQEQVNELKMIRSGFLGIDAGLHRALDSKAREFLESSPTLCGFRDNCRDVAGIYSARLKERSFFTKSAEWPYFIAKVKNAEHTAAYLQDCGIKAARPALEPLHLKKELASRWREKPSYPIAESWGKKLIALPTDIDIVQVGTIVDHLLEVNQ